MVPPGRSFPSCSARRMIPMAARSFRLPPGLRYSSFAKTSPDPDGTRRLSCSMGVSPTSWVMSSATRRRDISEVFRLTLQGTGDDGNRQSGECEAGVKHSYFWSAAECELEWWLVVCQCLLLTGTGGSGL